MLHRAVGATPKKHHASIGFGLRLGGIEALTLNSGFMGIEIEHRVMIIGLQGRFREIWDRLQVLGNV